MLPWTVRKHIEETKSLWIRDQIIKSRYTNSKCLPEEHYKEFPKPTTIHHNLQISPKKKKNLKKIKTEDEKLSIINTFAKKAEINHSSHILQQ